MAPGRLGIALFHVSVGQPKIVRVRTINYDGIFREFLLPAGSSGARVYPLFISHGVFHKDEKRPYQDPCFLFGDTSIQRIIISLHMLS